MEAVGIGCIWFAQKDDAKDGIGPTDWSPAVHVSAIRTALSRLDNVSNIEIDGDVNSISTNSFGHGDDFEEENFFPLYSTLSISFDLFVPSRLQEKYFDFDELTAGAEIFHVHIIYYGGMPLAYIHYTVGGSEDQVHQYSPSRAVVIVREFLEEKLSDDPVIDFQMLGPSPLHANVFIDDATTASIEAKDLSIAGGGYRTLFFRTAAKDSIAQALGLASADHRVLTAFYMTVHLRNRARRINRALTDGALELIAPPSSLGRWAAFQRWRSFRHRIDAAFATLLQEKLNRVELDSHQAEIDQDDLIHRSNLFYLWVPKT